MVSNIDGMMLTSNYWKRDQFKKALCVSVLDEANGSVGNEATINTQWNNFKTDHPDRSFVVLHVDRGSPTRRPASQYPTYYSPSSFGYGFYDLAPSDEPLPSALLNDLKSSDPKYAYIPNADVLSTNTITAPRPTSGDPDYGRPDRVWNENGTYYWWNKRTQSYINIDAINANNVGGSTAAKFLGTPRQHSFIPRWEWEMQWTYSWFDIIDNFAIDIKTDPYQDFNNKIFLFIDDSGSMYDEDVVSSYLRFLYEAESYGYDVYVVSDPSERFIDVFQTFTGEQVDYQSESDSIGLFMPSDVTLNLGTLYPTPDTKNAENMTPSKYRNTNGIIPNQFLQKANLDILSWAIPNYSFTTSNGTYQPYKDYPARLFKAAAPPVTALNLASINSHLQVTTQDPHNLVTGDLVLCYGGDLTGTPNHPIRDLTFFVDVVDSYNIKLYQAKSGNFYDDAKVAPDLTTYVNAGTNGVPTGSWFFFVQKYEPVESIVDKFYNGASKTGRNTRRSEYITQLSVSTPGNQVNPANIGTNPSSTFFSYLNVRHQNVFAANKYLVTNTKNSIMNFSIDIT